MSTEKKLSDINFFVSSTFIDLKVHRDVVIKKIKSQAGVINAQEFFGSRDNKPLDTCLSEVQKSNVFILLVGFRYGSIDRESGKSFTELEYEEAKVQAIPKFVFFLDQETPIPPKFVDTGEAATKLKEFKVRLMNDHTIDFFSTTEDLGDKVIQALINELPKKGFKIGNNEKAELQKDTFTILKNFLTLPIMHYGLEVKVDCILGDYQRAAEEQCKAFSLRYGASVTRSFKFADQKLSEEFRTLSEIYAEGKDAEELMSIPKNEKVNLTLKTIQGTVERYEPIFQIVDTNDFQFPNTMVWGSRKEKFKTGVERRTELICALQYKSTD